MKFINNELKRNCRLCGSKELQTYKFKFVVGDDYTKKIKKLPKYELKLQHLHLLVDSYSSQM